ncbi:uncharacterized protein [Panulirus ornatus]|uniref:uncharacterized protein isoform X2 n=1 Tax=Panulirus ornatus TaxID=150431 RepID=UPI003A8885FE
MKSAAGVWPADGRRTHDSSDTLTSAPPLKMAIFPLLALLCGVMMGASAVSPPYYKVPQSPFCPPQDTQYGFFCDNNCSSDQDCEENKYCCSLRCGNTCLGKYQATYSPNCPTPNPDLRCRIFLHNCISDEECPGSDHYCCPTNCGNTCEQSRYIKHY